MNTPLRKFCARSACVCASLWAVTSAPAQVKVDKPVIDPASGHVPVAVTLSVLEPGAAIRYTLDGLAVTESSTAYTAPFSVNEAGVLRAKAFKEGLESSDASWAFFGAPFPPATTSLATSVLDDNSGLISLEIDLDGDPPQSSVAVLTKIPGALVPTILSGDGFWDLESREIRWGPFSHPSDLTLRFSVSGPPGDYPIETELSVNGTLSATNTDSLTLVNTATPRFSPEKVPTPKLSISGAVSFPVAITILDEDPLLQYRYTLDGSTPTVSSAIYNSDDGVEIMENAILRMRAFSPEGVPGAIVSAQYYAAIDGVHIPVVTSLDVSDPEVQLLAFELSPSLATSHAFTLQLPPLVELISASADAVYDSSSRSVRWGPYDGSDSKVLSVALSGNPGAYRLQATMSEDGQSLALADIAVDFPPDYSGKQTSLPEKVTLPTLSLRGSDTLPVTLTIEHDDLEATLRYTTDGTLPSESSPIYSDSIELTEPTLLIVRAFKNGFLPSLPVYGFFQQNEAINSSIEVARTITSNGTVAPEVQLQVASIGNTSAYIIEEQLPKGISVTELSHGGAYDVNSGLLRWGPFTDNQNRTLSYRISERTGQFILSGRGSVDGRSVPVSGDELATLAGIPDQKVALPSIEPKPSGVFPVRVTIETDTADATIYYTMDGSTPDESSLQYTEPFEITTISTIKARAFLPFSRPSDTVVQFYGGKSVAEDALANRTLLSTETGDPVVSLEVDPSELVQCTTYTEFLPEDLQATAISEGGFYNSSNHSIKWGPFFGSSVRTLTYTPIAEPGIYAVAGELSVDGYSKSSVGEIDITVGDWTEVSAYIENNYGDNPVSGVIVSPGQGSKSYTVEALLPEEQAPSAISGDGVYNQALATVKWGPYSDNLRREVHLEFSGNYAEFDMNYRISVNGISLEVGIAEPVTIGIPAPDGVRATAGDQNVYLEWNTVAAATGYEIYYHTADDFDNSDLLARPGTETSYRARGLENDTSYYFWVLAKDESRVSPPSAMVVATPSGEEGFRAKIELDNSSYSAFGEDVTIRLEDLDLDINDSSINHASVQVASQSDPVGFSLTLTETSMNSGVFTGDITLISTESAPENKALFVREGDWIGASYQDAKPSSIHSAYATFGFLDSDGDGLPDWWERENFGNTVTVGRETDFDHDGQTDYDEWLGGSDPKSGSSRFEMKLLINQDGTITLRWPSVAERRYRLQKRVDAEFIDLQQGIQPTPPFNEYQDLYLPDQPVLYRVIAAPVE